MPKPKREMVKHPLTPTRLSEMGVLDDTPLPAGPFEPEGNWSQSYRVWTCYGYTSGSNKDQGTLALTKTGSGGKAFRLGIEQVLRMDPKGDKLDHRISANVRCRSDELATPAEWKLRSEFTGGREGQKPEQMGHEEAVEVSKGKLIVTVDDITLTRKAPKRFTANWCLFEAVQRMAPGATAIEFDLLEGLTVWKRGQRLTYRGRLEQMWGSETVELECFQQLGTGVWPYEFWLDDEGRLVMVITGVRAYIIEPAEGSVSS